jgi:HdeA/HdeB family
MRATQHAVSTSGARCSRRLTFRPDVAVPPDGARCVPLGGGLTKRLGSIAGTVCLATAIATATASAQQKKPPQPPTDVTALVVMTPTGPATCDTWIKWRAPGADPRDKAAIEYWAEGYLSGLAAGSHHDVIGLYRTEAAAAWLNNYCTANPKTPLPIAIYALGYQMVTRHGGPL